MLERVDEIELSPLEGEVLLRSMLRDGTSDVRRIFPNVERSGADAWRIYTERLDRADQDEALHVVETLARLNHPQASELLERALDAEEATAERVMGVLGGVETMLSVELLKRAIEQDRLRPQAQEALSRLASSWGFPVVAERAAEVLAAALVDEAASPEVAEALLGLASSRHIAVAARALPLLGKVEQVRAVGFSSAVWTSPL